MQIDIIDNLASIKELKVKWDDLFDRAQSGLFSHHTWVYENLRCFETKDILLLAVYGDKKSLIGIFPFTINTFRVKWLKFRALTHAGSAVTDYSQFIIDPDTNSRLMIKRVLEKLTELQPGRWDIFKIDNLSDADEISNLFRNLMLKTLHAGVTATEITPIIKYSRGYEEAKKTANIKRRFKKIAETSTVTHSTGNDISEDLLEKFSHLHKASYPNSALDNNQARKFYRALIDDTDINHQICLSYVSHEEQIIAAHFGFMDTNTFYYYVPTYDAKFSTYGPGQFLLWKLISMARDKKLVEFDFLRGSEAYKYAWTNKINTNYTVIGVSNDSSYFRKLIVNLWLITKEIPNFKQQPTG
jgi:CelD/BcsL family acetyltransferase involved in cellulose biosynthesis